MSLFCRRSFFGPKQLRFFSYSTGSQPANASLTERLLSKDIPTVALSYDVYKDSSSSIPKPPVVILHGLFGCKSNNRTIAKMINESLQRDVYCLDLRNHGDSPHDQRHDYPALAADVERFIDEQGLGESILIGHSMGAKAAMAVSLRSKSKVNMLISVDNAPISLPPGGVHVKYVQIMEKIVQNPEITSNKEANNYFAKFEEDIAIRQFLLQNIRKDKDTGLMRSRIPLDIMKDSLVKGNIAAWEFDPTYTHYSGPSLFIRGTRSNYVVDEYLPDIGRFFPSFEVRDVEAGHWVLSEKPNECLDLILDFVQRNEDE